MLLRTLVLISTLGFCIAQANEPDWPSQPYSYFADQVELSEVLRSFASAQGISIVLSDKVQGKVSGQFLQQTPATFLQNLLQAYNLIDYYDGSAVYIYRSDEIETSIIKLHFYPVEDFQTTLEKLGILDYQVVDFKALVDEGIVFVSGPKQFIKLAEDAATALDADFASKARRQERLVYHWQDKNNRHHYSTVAPPKGQKLIETITLTNSQSSTNNTLGNELAQQVEKYHQYLQAIRDANSSPTAATATSKSGSSQALGSNSGQ